MKIKVIVISVLFLLCGCNSNKEIVNTVNTEIKLLKETLEYGEEIYLYDLISITDGSITTKNYLIDTYELINNQNIVIKYKDYYKKEQTYEFKISIVDSSKPLILSSNNLYVNKDEEINILASVICVDNYDKEVKCEVEGTYDTSALGEYNLKIKVMDSNNNSNEKDIKLIVEEPTDEEWKLDDYKISDLISKYKTDDTMIGIDISEWQKDINYEEVKKSGVEFVMIRIGWGHDDDMTIKIDEKFKDNIKNAKKAGLKVGVYFYSYAVTKNEAKNQAKWIIKTLNKEKLDLPIAFDWEDWNNLMSYKLNTVELNDIAKTFMKEIEKNDYKAMNYGSARYMEYIWDLEKYPAWLAYYTSNNDYSKNYYMWQITSAGIVPGINGYVDLNILYK